MNRFAVTPSKKSTTIGKRHAFAFGLRPSRVQPGTSSIQLDYAQYNSRLSPWYTMMDEVRLIHAASDGSKEETDVLIGMGCVAWGGGFWNAAPFCLWKERGDGNSESSKAIEL